MIKSETLIKTHEYMIIAGILKHELCADQENDYLAKKEAERAAKIAANREMLKQKRIEHGETERAKRVQAITILIDTGAANTVSSIFKQAKLSYSTTAITLDWMLEQKLVKRVKAGRRFMYSMVQKKEAEDA